MDSFSKYYIPATFKSGKSKSDHTFRIITFKHTNGAWLQNSKFKKVTGFPSLDKIADSEMAVRRDLGNVIENHDNTPVSGFKLKTLTRRCESEEPVILTDPRGWSFSIRLCRFIECIRKGISIDGDGNISGEWVYASDLGNQEVTILCTSWNEYSEAVKETDVTEMKKNLRATMTKNALKVGSVYRFYRSRDFAETEYERVVYLGEFKHVPDIKQYSMMMKLLDIGGTWMNNAENIRLKLLDKLEESRMVFVKLSDNMVHSLDYRYANGKFTYLNDTDTVRRRRWVTYEDFDPSKSEFSLVIDYIDDVGKSSVIALKNLDSCIIRGLDDNQEIRIFDDWMTYNKTQFNWGEEKTRHKLLRFSINNVRNQPHKDPTANMFHFSTYTVEELTGWINYLIDKHFVPNILKTTT